MKIRGLRSLVMMVGWVNASAQTVAPPAFEVATIKPSAGLAYPRQLGPERFSATGGGLRDLITLAYGLNNDQLAGVLDWMTSDRYDVQGKADQSSTPDQIKDMLKTLLAERFQLKFHRESRVVSGYALIVDPKGAKLTPSKDETPRGVFMIDVNDVSARSASMTRLAEFLSMDRKQHVIDMTGLSGYYDFRLSYDDGELTRDDATASDPKNGSIFSSLQALGLKLRSQKVPLEMFVIDRAEKPAEN